MRSDDQYCASCKFAHLEANELIVECRRFPPADFEPEQLADENGTHELDAHHSIELVIGDVRRFPRVKADDWCGEWAQE